MRRCRRAGRRAIPGRQDLAEPAWWLVAVTDLEQRADEVADHVVEESGALHGEVETAWSFHEVHVLERAHRAARARVAGIRRERREVVRAAQTRCGLAHRSEVDRSPHPVVEATTDRRPIAADEAAIG